MADYRGSREGEKPILNEEFYDLSIVEEWNWDFHRTKPFGEKKSGRGAAAAVKVKKDDTDKTASTDNSFKKGLRQYHMKRWENALQEFMAVDTEGFSNEQQSELAYYLGLCNIKMENYDDAITFFEHVVNTGENPVWIYQCHMIISYIYIKTGRAELAESELSRLINGGLESVMMYNTLAYAAYLQKRYQAAVEYYEKTLEIDRDNPTALNSMGYILADTGMDRIKGLRLIRRAVEKNPDNAAYLDSLGWAAYQCGKNTEALSWLRKAIALAPNKEEIKKHFKIVNREVR